MRLIIFGVFLTFLPLGDLFSYEGNEINEIKNNSGLSNKKWDKTIKLLKSKSLIEVFKKNESFYIKKIIKN